jgi:hypothetical protein
MHPWIHILLRKMQFSYAFSLSDGHGLTESLDACVVLLGNILYEVNIMCE